MLYNYSQLDIFGTMQSLKPEKKQYPLYLRNPRDYWNQQDRKMLREWKEETKLHADKIRRLSHG